MTKLYLAWQDRRNRRWYPIGRMSQSASNPLEYEFEYVRGAEVARNVAPPFAIPVPGFPDLGKNYRAPDVFPAFRYRAMNRGRPDLSEYLESLGLDTEDSDVIEELAVSGGHSVKDSFETFPAIEPDRDGKFKARFIVHGLRLKDHTVVDKVASLNSGDHLNLAIESSNLFGAHAVGVKTEDQRRLGWLPRYLADVLRRDDGWEVKDLEVRVARVNHEAPLSHRLLVELNGRLPPGVDPMSELEMYQPISTSHKT
jgi:hypothetical protein